MRFVYLRNHARNSAFTIRKRVPGARLSPKTRRRLIIAAVAAVTLIIWFSVFLARTFKNSESLFLALAQTKASEFFQTSVTQILSEEAAAGTFDYDSLVTLKYDNEGNISAITTDSGAINKLQFEVAYRIARDVLPYLSSEYKIPLGDICGGVLLFGHGPKVTVKLSTVNNLQTEITNDFSEAGVNMTRHKIGIRISADIAVLYPGGHNTVTMVTDVAVAETVIVGRVPGVVFN
ncbi:MAG: sporulation protein YunB [Oscillospiraceae bacterium]|jgi:sporulation protein YunB|nr:sporulation protein YunB [Oscillospiraceae bacterium]